MGRCNKRAVRIYLCQEERELIVVVFNEYITYKRYTDADELRIVKNVIDKMRGSLK